MIQKKTIIPVILLAFCCLCCIDNREKRKEIVADKIMEFSEKQEEWDNLTHRILKDSVVKINAGKLIDPLNFSKSILLELTEKGVYKISVSNNTTCQTVRYITNWTEYPIGTLYLTWTTCDDVQTRKGYYKDNFDLNFIEVWGIGNNWLIMIDSDFI